MAIPNNPATALDTILRKVATSGATTVGEGWKLTLGAEPGTAEFALRHGEAVGLMNKVLAHLTSLDPGEVESRLYLQYVPAWHGAVVFRDGWGRTDQPASKIIRLPILDHLMGLGLHMEVQRRAVYPELSDDKLENLRESLAEWRKLVEEAGLPTDLAQQVKTLVDHIDWLLSNTETFGTEPVMENARTLFGLSVPVIRFADGKWKKTVVAAMAGLVLFLNPIADATEEANRILTNVSETVSEIREFGSPEPQKALPPGDGANVTADDESASDQ
ncbi:hypothetical protein [Gordonia polyisoprenivorans]|uniref:hypothetical protein n=1 Tax=Gordonia polyisoprenivorans TaxID=84595 RepID=UPI001AD7DB77|nr:hypothetical protein [Gordonia polyisoprenivorans]QTI67390.1 hypothetical protein J6U32_17470 [Gordonia polyisoprenivorans]